VVIAHPEFEVVERMPRCRFIGADHADSSCDGRLSARVLRRIVWDVLERLDAAAVAPMLPSAGFDAAADALRQIHFPDSEAALEKARRHLVLSEFFAMQLCVAAKRAEQAAIRCNSRGSGALMERLHGSLPFALTGAQQRAIAEIRADLLLHVR
jgi:ATP-dependent DNA helicase RecG